MKCREGGTNKMILYFQILNIFIYKQKQQINIQRCYKIKSLYFINIYEIVLSLKKKTFGEDFLTVMQAYYHMYVDRQDVHANLSVPKHIYIT